MRRRVCTILKVGLNETYHMDCLEGMKLIEERSIDMILCDLPYGTTKNKWDSIIPLEPLWDQYKRIIKENGAIVLTAVKPFSAQLILSNLQWFRYDLIWSKNKSTGFLNANRMPLRSHEEILVFYKKLPTYNPQKTTGHRPVNGYYRTSQSNGSNYGRVQVAEGNTDKGGQTTRHPTSVWDIKVVNNDDPEKSHPTQKPVELFEKLILTYTNAGDTVLDNCMGSGTTAIACLNTGRNYIGFETEEKYIKSIEERLARHKKEEAPE